MLSLFAMRLAQLRRARELTVDQVALRAGYHPTYIRHMEKGRRLPARIEVLDRLVVALALGAADADKLKESFIWTTMLGAVQRTGVEDAAISARQCANAMEPKEREFGP